MEKYKKILPFLPFLLSVCSGIYLTYMVDRLTLESFLQRTFVFIFFVAAIYLSFCLFKKYVGFEFCGKIIAAALILSLAVISFCEDSFFPKKEESVITVEAVIEDGANHPQEVWLSEIEIDGKAIPVSEINIVSNTNWTYVSGLDDYVYYPVSNSSIENINSISFKVNCESLKIIFARNSWSGKVAYNLSGSKEFLELELYSADSSVQTEVLSIDLSAAKSPVKMIFSAVGAIITLTSFIYMLLVIIKNKLSKRKIKSAFSENFINNALVFGVYCVLVAALLRIFAEEYEYVPESITLDVGFIALLFVFPYASRILTMLKKMKIAEYVLLLFVVFVITFQTVAEVMFMELHKSTVTFTDILAFIIAMIIVLVPVLEITLFVDNHTKRRFLGGEKVEK